MARERGIGKERRSAEKMRLKQYREFIYPAIIIIFVYVCMHFMGIGCPIKFVTGVSCLGCGMTRAWGAVLRFDFDAAFYYHPLFAVPPAVLVIYLFKSKMNLKIYKIIMLTIMVAFITIYLYRLIYAEGDVVVFEPRNNILFRIFGYKRK